MVVPIDIVVFHLHSSSPLPPSFLPLSPFPSLLPPPSSPSQDGLICERGTHAELLEADGVYAAMWNQQQRSLDKGSVAEQAGGETEL